MQTEIHAIWTPFATLAQESGANPIFNQANPGQAPAGGGTPTAPGTTGAPVGSQPSASPFGGIMLPLFAVLAVFIILNVFTSRKQDKKRRELLGAIKKYDKVVTIGGIIGTVVELRDDEVVLKVDDHSSTKIRFTRAAIQSVLRPPERPSPPRARTRLSNRKTRERASAQRTELRPITPLRDAPPQGERGRFSRKRVHMRHLGRNAVLVIAVLLISLASIYPPEKKLRLGKDLQGGFNVVYQVDVGADFSSRDATLDKVIQVIKDRLDPNGLLDISIVKAGSDRIEIAMPLPGEESKKLHAAFDAEMDKLVTVALDKAALDRALQTPAGEREKELERLSHGSADRLARFRAAAEAYDAYRAADAAYQEAAKKMTELQANLRQAKAKAAELGEDYIKLIEDGIKAQEQIATPLADAANASEENYKAKAQAVLSTVITRDEVEHALTRRSGVIRVPNPDDPKAPIVLPSPREKAIAELLARHPEAADQIKVVAAAWETIEKNVQINDPNDLIRLLEGSGVLNFRITVNPNELGAEERELRQQFRTLGPLNARTDQARWFKINKIENWFKTKAQYDELQADPAAYLQRSHGLVSEPFEGDYYILCWDKRGYRLTERDGSNWELRSAFRAPTASDESASRSPWTPSAPSSWATSPATTSAARWPSSSTTRSIPRPRSTARYPAAA